MKAEESLPPAAAYALQEGQALTLGAGLSLLRDGENFVYLLFTQPFASLTRDDKVSRNLCLGRRALYGHATQAALADAFGLNARTVGRAKVRLQQRGESGFVRPRKPRRRHGIEDPEVLARAAEMLQAGQSLYRVAKQLGVNCSTLWRYSKEGRLPASQCPPRRAASSAAGSARKAAALVERLQLPADGLAASPSRSLSENS